jgi:hypothetical protein
MNRSSLAGGRALRAGDINIADISGSPTALDAANLKVRADRALASLGQLQTNLQTALHMRAVTPDLLDETSHYLPAAYFAFNAEDQTVSTDFFTVKP